MIWCRAWSLKDNVRERLCSYSVHLPRLTCGNKASRSLIRCLMRWVTPREESIRTLSFLGLTPSLGPAFSLLFLFSAAARTALDIACGVYGVGIFSKREEIQMNALEKLKSSEEGVT